MNKVCSLRLCIIGSTGFGKSSIAASLIHTAVTTNGGVHLLGSPTKILQMADDLNAHGQHTATGWDDIVKFQFRLQGKEGKAWQVSLRDYPGALFAKYVDRISFWDRIKRLFRSKAQTMRQTDVHTFDPTAERKAIRLISELEQSDALIVLVPADVANTKYGTDRVVYKQKLPEFIEKVLKRSPHTPVCLCINKWDMFDCGIEKLADKLAEAPFADYYQSLKLTCAEDLSVAAISAFGRHDPNDPEKIDKTQEQKPVNVLETMLALAEKAEKARFERAKEIWQKSSWWQKTFIAPLKMVPLLRAGSTDRDMRSGLWKMAAKAWGSLALVAGLVLALTTTAVYIHDEQIASSAKAFYVAEANKDTGPSSDPDERRARAERRTNNLETARARLTFPHLKSELTGLISQDVKLLDGDLKVKNHSMLKPINYARMVIRQPSVVSFANLLMRKKGLTRNRPKYSMNSKRELTKSKRAWSLL